MQTGEALISIYRENPCSALPNALWKTLATMDRLETSFHLIDGTVTHFESWGKDGLYTYWNRNNSILNSVPHKLKQSRFALLHQNYMHALSALPAHHFSEKESYFRLLFRNKPVLSVEVPTGFHIKTVDAQTQAADVARFISACYEYIHPTENDVRSWTQHPVFDPDLWAWLIDETSGNPAALGIAEVDSTVSEGSLEWIQVLPAYQRRGLGKAVVMELLHRLQKRVAFTTVSGEINNPTTPEALYRKCGFEGNDVWWVLRA